MIDGIPPLRQFSADLPKGGGVELSYAGPTIVRLRITTAPGFDDPPSYAITRQLFPHMGVWCSDDSDDRYAGQTMGGVSGFALDAYMNDEDGEVADPIPHDDEAAKKKSYLSVELDTKPFKLRIAERNGSVRFETPDDAISIEGEKITLKRILGQGERIYGLGEHGEVFDRNPGRYRIWNKDEANHQPFRQYYCTIPFGVSSPGGEHLPHGFLVDNPGDINIDVGATDPGILSITTHTGILDLWLIFEDTTPEILEEYSELTGRMKRPPMWALGFQQCRWSYLTSQRVREVAAEMRSRRIPCDTIYMDIDYMEKFRVFTWNSKDFADYEPLLQDLIRDNFSPMCIVDPGVAIADDYEPYRYGMATPGFFLGKRGADKPIEEEVWPGPVHHPDFTDATVRAKWGEWQNEALLEKGIAGVWNDMNEPAVFQQGGGTREFPGEAIHQDEGRFRTHAEIHNVYGQTMARASFEGQMTHRPNVRPFTLTRSGWAGIQRYSAVWTGDNRSAWGTMPLDIALNLNMGMSGVPFVGCDIGGFASDATPELFTRWMEWGVFQPFCRAHSAMGTRDQEPWAFGPETERICRGMLELRYQLIPYIYTQFVEASETGMPINRPLALEFPNDATVGAIGDQFLLGPDMLVAPILEPGKRHRVVYLPAGDWVHFWSRRREQGGRWLMVEAPYGQPPLFIRAGAVVPMHPIRQHLKGTSPETVYLDVFPAANLSGRMIEDDGVSFDYEQGAEARVLFSGQESETHLNLTIGAPQGRYRSPRKRWTVRLHRGDRAVRSVKCAGQDLEAETRLGTTEFTIPDNGKAQEVRVEYDV